MSDLLTYLWAVGAAWFNDFWVLTALPEAASYLMPPALIGRVTAWLDKWSDPESRRKAYVWIAVLGIFFASFSAWDEQYRAVNTVKSFAPIAGSLHLAPNSIEATVPLPQTITGRYVVTVTPNWNTTVIIEGKKSDHFMVGFNTPAWGDKSMIDWQLTPLPK